ncbi:MAG: nickel-dependent lactate racemase [Deltaproteobacteria bacterium]|nr:nickel-dependent lactate racemase [Deltaproteobacteria bacterium]
MYTVPFGKNHLSFGLPAGMKGTIAQSLNRKPLSDLQGAISQALAAPIQSPPLHSLAKPGDRVCIVFTDMTRAAPDHLLVPAMLKDLASAGIPDDRITLLCGVGLHRPTTPEEKAIKLGQEVVDRYRVVDHRAEDAKDLVDLGKTETGIPLSVNRLAYEADLLIATGIVEPHQFAGYSGGRKTVAVGAAGEGTIAYTHGPRVMDHPGTRLGNIDGNPFHEAVTEAARRAGLKFILNVVQDEQKRPTAVLAGEPEATFQKLVSEARNLYEVPIPNQYDVAVAGVGFPKDANIYQACRAASYLFFAPVPVVKEGGVIIVPAPTPEGSGEGTGEKRFFEKMRGARDMSSLLKEMRATGYPPGAQRAFIIAKVLENVHIIVVGSETPDIIRQVHMIPADDMETAFRISAQKIGRTALEVLIVPHALLTLPIIS